MKDLLNAAKAKLRTDIAYVKDRDVYVTEDVAMIRKYGDYPAIGLKDGGTTYAVQASDQTDGTLILQAACYVKLHKPEAAIMGDAATGEKGLLEMAGDMITSLDTTFNGLVDLAEPVSISESQVLSDENQFVQMLFITMRYTREV